MNETMQTLLLLLRKALWDAPVSLPEGFDSAEIYRELSSHAVASVADSALLAVCQDPAVRRQWQMELLQQRCQNEEKLYAQTVLVELLKTAGIPTVILKGTAAAQYYPQPGKRLLGDVDFLVPENQFEAALSLLKKNGYSQAETGSNGSWEVALHKDVVLFELHCGLNLEDPNQAAAMSRKIQADISRAQLRAVEGHSFPALPDPANGLVLLAHIRQHLRGGLGLRQILDWMLYSFHCLDDTMWHGGFQAETRQFGLETLARTVTRMCQLYLGLPEENRTWCSGADEALCRELLQYVLDGGNFGRKEPGYDRATRRALMHRKYTWEMVRSLHNKGLRRPLVQKYPVIKPFAWCIQLGHYIFETVKRGSVIQVLNKDMKKARKLQVLLDALEDHSSE